MSGTFCLSKSLQKYCFYVHEKLQRKPSVRWGLKFFIFWPYEFENLGFLTKGCNMDATLVLRCLSETESEADLRSVRISEIAQKLTEIATFFQWAISNEPNINLNFSIPLQTQGFLGKKTWQFSKSYRSHEGSQSVDKKNWLYGWWTFDHQCGFWLTMFILS